MADAVLEPRPLPVGAIGRIGVGWWGLLCFLATEASLFGYLIFTYTYICIQLPPATAPLSHLSFRYSLPMTIIVIASSAVLWWAEQGILRGRRGQLVIGFSISLVLSISFVVLESFEWRAEHFTLTSSALGSAFFVATGTHLMHFILGILVLVFMILWSLLGYFDETRNTHVLVTTAYWNLVHAVWIVLFVALYVVPYLG